MSRLSVFTIFPLLVVVVAFLDGLVSFYTRFDGICDGAVNGHKSSKFTEIRN